MNLNFSPEELLILKVAMSEYVANRGRTPQEYLDRRYPLSEGNSEKFRKDKLEQIHKNMAIASEIQKKLYE